MVERLNNLKKLFLGNKFETSLKDYLKNNSEENYEGFCKNFANEVDGIFLGVKKEASKLDHAHLISFINQMVAQTNTIITKCSNKLMDIDEIREDISNDLSNYYFNLTTQGKYTHEAAEIKCDEARKKIDDEAAWKFEIVCPALQTCSDILEFYLYDLKADFAFLPEKKIITGRIRPVPTTFKWIGDESKIQELYNKLKDNSDQDRFITDTSEDTFKKIFSGCYLSEITTPINWVDKSEKRTRTAVTVFQLIYALSNKKFISPIDLSGEAPKGLYALLSISFFNFTMKKDVRAWRASYKEYQKKDSSARSIRITEIVNSL